MKRDITVRGGTKVKQGHHGKIKERSRQCRWQREGHFEMLRFGLLGDKIMSVYNIKHEGWELPLV